MLKAFALFLALLAPVPACSSSSTGACGTISGTYSDTETVSPGGCLPSAGTGTVTITGPGPDHNVTLPNVQGSCPATSSGCSLSAQCNINLSDSAGNPVGLATVLADWTFSMTGFTGQSSVVLKRPDGTSCTATLSDTATKQ